MDSTANPKNVEETLSAHILDHKELVTQVSSIHKAIEDSLIKIVKTINALRVVVLLISIVLSVVIVIKGIMAIWYTVFNDQFWVVIAGMVCACAGKTVNSRCRSVSICGPRGCLSFERGREPDNIPQPVPTTIPETEPGVEQTELPPVALTRTSSGATVASPQDSAPGGYRLPSEMPAMLPIPPSTAHYPAPVSPAGVISPISVDSRI